MKINKSKNQIITIAIIFFGIFGLAKNSSAAWDPIIGVSEPLFGVNETAPAAPNPWNSGVAGFYYVCSDCAGATDNSNSYGYPTKPRLTIPLDLPAGAVVEIHGSTDANGWGEVNITGEGTPEQPIFIRGINNPRINNFVDVGYYGNASYIIIEGINAFSVGFLGRQNGTSFTNHHLVLRNSEVHGDLDEGGVGVSSWTNNSVNNVVISGNNIHDNGDINADYDQDVHGIGVGSGASYVWVLDNEMARNSGDGIQINGFGMADPALLNHIYVGRNVSHHNKQTGFWTKTAQDVIFSQNIAYGHRPSNSSYGAGMGFQYAPGRVWFLYNHVYDNTCGICSSSDSTTFGQDSYIIGNVIHNIKPGFDPAAGGWGGGAMMLAGGINRYVIGNTIYDVDAGINTPSSEYLYMHNNIISDITNAQGNHIYIENAGIWEAKNDLFYQNGSAARIKLGNAIYSVPQLESSYAAQAQNNITADTQFVNAAGNNFQLQSGSPAINAGLVSAVYNTFQTLYGLNIAVDYAGLSRPQNSIWDIGAYEYQAGGDVTPPSAPSGLSVQ